MPKGPILLRVSAVAALTWLSTAAALAAEPCAQMYAEAGRPAYRGDPPPHAVLCRRGYVLSHNGARKTPDWVIEALTPQRFEGPAKGMRAKVSFIADPDLEPGERATAADYAGKGFDRGHMAPAADMAFDTEALRESFYLSNVAPQQGRGLNRHIWADLEKLTRDWACERGRLIVITGPIHGPKAAFIGDAVAVPAAFYKIVYDPGLRRAIAFILPNRAIDKGGKSAPEALKPFRVSVDEVERETALDFLTALPKGEETRLERARPVMWPVGKGCG